MMGTGTSQLQTFARDGGEATVSDISKKELNAFMQILCDVKVNHRVYNNQICNATIKLPLDANLKSEPISFDDNDFDQFDQIILTDKGEYVSAILSRKSFKELQSIEGSIKNYQVIKTSTIDGRPMDELFENKEIYVYATEEECEKLHS